MNPRKAYERGVKRLEAKRDLLSKVISDLEWLNECIIRAWENEHTGTGEYDEIVTRKVQANEREIQRTLIDLENVEGALKIAKTFL